ncbi:hypothetical protein PEL8287_03659 [Roseovarius litorisediminis]|uniref:Lipoprotein n=1 Tax=Roseovarius litorisediminis TaxID=1312363 RepID=A0A1Y5TKR6_9RHOB|nr:hypothetical protein [Roseovarius litorisediminis]SLN66305.1 hypothetical protein PEL8287_03659 [Roseovarius litorisediminis]
MPKFLKLLLTLSAIAFLGACADEKHYPISGEECSADDPVQDLDASIADCTPSV